MNNRRYTPEQVWIEAAADGITATVGITHHAQDALGDIVFVELPALGTSFDQNAVAAIVESVKTAADVFIPAGGEVVQVNEDLRANPSLANTDPLQAGWFFKIRLADLAQLSALMDDARYREFEKTA